MDEPRRTETTPVYDTARHEPLAAEAWCAERVRREILHIAEDFEAAARPDGSWPTHPLDHPTREPRWFAYAGAAGAVVALRVLRREGTPVKDPSERLEAIHAAWFAHPDIRYETGLQLGEIGILAPAVAADPTHRALVRRLEESMTRTVGHPAREITSGETGMLHAALTLFRETGDERWRRHYRRGADSLWSTWSRRPGTGEWLWRNRIFGSVRSYYGACHGVAGNVGAFVRGGDLLPPGRAREALARAGDTLARGALRHGGDVNWPVSGDPSGRRRLVQWCHGAPGVVAALAAAPRSDDAASARLDALLLEAGELVWKAGPLAKGPGLCHGTAGNGYAFLALYGRTGDVRWLERARRFAMHAIGQRRRARERFGQGRYTLWTGDGGLAVYLHHCLAPERAAFPGLEVF